MDNSFIKHKFQGTNLQVFHQLLSFKSLHYFILKQLFEKNTYFYESCVIILSVHSIYLCVRFLFDCYTAKIILKYQFQQCGLGHKMILQCIYHIIKDCHCVHYVVLQTCLKVITSKNVVLHQSGGKLLFVFVVSRFSDKGINIFDSHVIFPS